MNYAFHQDLHANDRKLLQMTDNQDQRSESVGIEQTKEAPAVTFYFQCVFPETVLYVMLNSVVLYFIRADVQAKLNLHSCLKKMILD